MQNTILMLHLMALGSSVALFEREQQMSKLMKKR